MGNVPNKCDTEAGIVQQDLCIEGRPMASWRSCEHGYEDERFEQVVSENFHCVICTNVLKDPAMCCRNEHIFCRAYITEHLAKSQTCPTCIELLTVETLRVPPRIVLGCLSEFKIRCDFYDRGCGQIVQLGKLERHVKECEFAPAVCSNEGCRIEVNARDLIHHETAVCEMRRVQCHNCAELKQEMETVKGQLTTVNNKLDGIGAKQKKFIADVNDKFNKLELNAQQLEADNKEIKQHLSVVVEQLGKISKATSHEASASQNEKKKSSVATKVETKVVKANLNIIVAGGSRTDEVEQAYLNSVEMFDIAKGTWTTLLPMIECRGNASSVVYDNQIIVSGGWSKTGGTKSMEALPNADQVTQSVIWKEFPAVLPHRTHGHSGLVYNDQVITVGGFTLNDRDSHDISKCIYDVSLTPPYSLKSLAYMRHKRLSLGMHLINDSFPH